MGITISRTRRLPKGCAVLLGLIFLIAGGLLAWFLGFRLMNRAGEVESWEKVPCRLERAELKVSTSGAEPGFSTDAAYEYQYGGKSWTGSSVFDGDLPDHANEIEEVLHGLRTASAPVCLVNPANPAEAVLVPPSRTGSYVVLAISAAFALAGILFVSTALFQTEGSSRGGPLIGFILSVIFAAGGGTSLWFASRDNWKEVSARMQSAPCIIVSSRVKTSTSTSKGRTKTSYRPDILFRYDWNGRAWHSEWTDFSKNSYSSSNRSGAEEIVRRHPTGAAQTCWVDPQQPWVAVLEKEARGTWLLWILGFVFGGLGALGLLYYIGKVFLLGWLLRSESKSASGPPALPPGPPASGPPPLPPGD